MKVIHNLSLFLLLFLLYCKASAASQNEEEVDEVFKPTSEWKIVKKGQKIPKGLHVRINLETRLTEAKLIDNSEKSNHALLAVDKNEEKFEDLIHGKSISKADLVESMKNIKDDVSVTHNEIKLSKNKYRSYDELKKILGEANLTPKTDAEIMTGLIKSCKTELAKTKLNIKKIRKVLEDLEFLTHQIDNAIEFVSQNGFKEIVYKNLNSTNVELKTDTLHLMSSLLQNNPKVQIHVLETGGIGILLRMLLLESNLNIKLRSATALSCLLRRFPLAQKKFVEHGGLSVISKIIELGNVKLNVKFATLVNDLIIEHQLSFSQHNEDVVKQYNLVNFEEKLGKHEWCENVNKLLYTLALTDEENHDSIEKCLQSMKTTVRSCAKKYSKDILKSLHSRYDLLALRDINKNEEENNSAFYNEIKEICHFLINYHNHLKTEL